MDIFYYYLLSTIIRLKFTVFDKNGGFIVFN